ncbi:MAG: NUDIX hydrolase [Candidatus Nanopelagicales bacterium]
MGERSQLSIPPELAARARALVAATSAGDGAWEPPPVRDAATVVMVRDDVDGLHVYLQRRVRTMAFAAGMYVFPGGAVEPQDVTAAAELRADVVNAAAWPFLNRPTVSPGEDNLENRIAAVRETLEETSHDLGDPLTLAYVGHWVTPEVEDRRFDTRFYAAEVVGEHHIHENSGESDADRWVRPADALAESAAGRMLMLPPTTATLTDFAAQAESGARAAEAIAAIAARPIVPLMPSPAADPRDPTGVRWRLVDFRDGTEIARIGGPPAGSESGGIHTSLGGDDG